MQYVQKFCESRWYFIYTVYHDGEEEECNQDFDKEIAWKTSNWKTAIRRKDIYYILGKKS